MNSVGETSARSTLDKPLAELTEEDIAQLTREDCRRFLKEKGMRRPSWNKSQAIQQVISLKTLLEVRSDSGDGIRQKPTPPPAPISLPSPRKEEPSPYRRRDPNPIQPPALFTCSARSLPVAEVAGREQISLENHFPPSRVEAHVPAGQMTIFYGGKVNVYNDVPAEKAQAIMQLAASPDLYDSPPGPVQASRPVPSRVNQDNLGPGPFPISPTGKSPPNFRENAEWGLARETDLEGPTGRQASLQRYLEKRKDRYKGKRFIGGSSSTSMEMMYLSQKLRGQIPNEQSSPSNASSPSQPRPPRTPTRCSSIENQAQKHHIFLDLNDDGGGN